MTSQDLAELRRRATAAAALHGCEAYLQESEQFRLESTRGVELRITVVRRYASGEATAHVDNVRLPHRALSETVARMVSDSARALPYRATPP